MELGVSMGKLTQCISLELVVNTLPTLMDDYEVGHWTIPSASFSALPPFPSFFKLPSFILVKSFNINRATIVVSTNKNKETPRSQQLITSWNEVKT